MRTAQPKAAPTEWEFETWARVHVLSSHSPAVLVRSDGSVVVANQQAHLLLDGDSLPAPVRAHVLGMRLQSKIQSVRSSLPSRDSEQGFRHFDFTFFPVPVGLVLIIARDRTLEANLLNALAASRQLFRDLALCSSDFAFETDATGHFTYVSPNGLLGFSPEELHGVQPRRVFNDAGVASLFSCAAPLREQEVWTSGKSGSDACVVITAMPMRDSQGSWCGTRGVAHDITALRCHEREIASVSAREELVHAVVAAMRAQVEPRRMLLAACDALCAATGSDFASISAEGTEHCVAIGTDTGSKHRLSVDTNYHGAMNGNVLLARNEASGSFQEAERNLLASIVPHLGVAIALVRLLTQVHWKKTTEAVA